MNNLTLLCADCIGSVSMAYLLVPIALVIICAKVSKVSFKSK